VRRRHAARLSARPQSVATGSNTARCSRGQIALLLARHWSAYRGGKATEWKRIQTTSPPRVRAVAEAGVCPQCPWRRRKDDGVGQATMPQHVASGEAALAPEHRPPERRAACGVGCQPLGLHGGGMKPCRTLGPGAICAEALPRLPQDRVRRGGLIHRKVTLKHTARGPALRAVGVFR
jgi:hypothetical protein